MSKKIEIHGKSRLKDTVGCIVRKQIHIRWMASTITEEVLTENTICEEDHYIKTVHSTQSYIKKDDGMGKYFCVPELSFRRQDLSPPAYIRNGSIYALSRDALLLKKLRFGGNNSIPYIMPAERSVNVDTELDFLLCDAIISNKGV